MLALGDHLLALVEGETERWRGKEGGVRQGGEIESCPFLMTLMKH